MNAPRKPRRPSETQKRPAYLEGFIGRFEGQDVISPPAGCTAKSFTTLAKMTKNASRS